MKLETSEELISFIKNSKKKTLSKAYINGVIEFKNDNIFIFKGEESSILIGDWKEIEAVIGENKQNIKNYFHLRPKDFEIGKHFPIFAVEFKFILYD